MTRIVSVCLSPTLQHTVSFARFDKGEVNRSTGFRLDASGKAVNAARVLSQLVSRDSRGESVSVIAPLGERNAAEFLSLAAADSLEVEWIPVPGNIRHCYTLLEKGETGATELVVGEPPESGTDYRALADRLLGLVARRLAPEGPGGKSALLLAGSKPGFWPATLFCELVALARKSAAVVMADFQGADLVRAVAADAPDIIKINESEFCATFGCSFPLDEDSLAASIREKSLELDRIIVVTRGMKDTLAARSGSSFREPVTPVEAVNVIGCGDSFSAGFLLSWLRDRDMAAALGLGKKSATLNALNARPGSILDPALPSERIPPF